MNDQETVIRIEDEFRKWCRDKHTLKQLKKRYKRVIDDIRKADIEDAHKALHMLYINDIYRSAKTKSKSTCKIS